MPLDANIILGVKPVEVANPAEMQAKALSLKQMAQRAQLQDQEIAANQGVKNAYNANVVTGADGSKSLNMKGVIQSLYASNPQKAQELEASATQSEFTQKQAQMKTLQDQTATAHELSMMMNDPSSYAMARQKGIELGLPNSDKLPTEFDPNYVKQLQTRTMSAKDRLEQFNKDRDYNLKAKEAAAKHKEGAGKVTENQSKSLGFGRRAMLADQMLDQIQSDPNFDVSSVTTQARMALPKWLGGIKDPKEQALLTAKLSFVASVLRKESGAAVTPEEFETYSKIYFPQPGDSDQSQMDKKVLRQNFIDTEKVTAGSAWKDPIPLKRAKTALEKSAPAAAKVLKTSEIEWAD